MDIYPKMLYKHPGREELHGSHFDTLIVADGDEQDAALVDGWKLTTTEAKESAEQPVQADPNPVVQGQDFDREALKLQATGLGLEFPKNVPTERLAEMVAEAKAKE